ncbi:site-specific integrase [Rhodobacter sp. JA431]|uniref:site-specific integrase n=1 Tax=Rhodobacter sp. JA431 TaxID=570013 RepID=UPI0011603AD0|nr:site-specific integrase [Rhodobacter sp. JA431]
MPGHTRLYRRGAVYYHRAAVPTDIAATYGKREETFSLKTRDYAEAVRRVRIAAVEVDRKFDEHRLRLARQHGPVLSELTPLQLSTIKATYLHHLLDEDEEIRLDGFEEVEEQDGERALVSEKRFEPRPTFEEHEELIEDLDAINRYNLARGKQDPFFRAEAEDVLTWDGIGIRLAANSPSWPRLIRALQEAHREATDAIKRRNQGDTVPTPPNPSEGASASPGGRLLSEAANAWADEKSRSAWSPKVRDDYLGWMQMFIEVAGDRPITDYQKKDARAFKEVLLKLPANSQKKAETRGLPIAQAAEKAAQLGLEPMSISTLNKALNRVGAFWNWAEGHFDEVQANLFKGLSVRNNVAARDQRAPFSQEELAKLYASPLFTGCRSERFASERGSVIPHNSERFWLPLMGLLTGARMNELCQLRVDDVKEQNGIPFLFITNEGDEQRVKTTNGKRRVPLHKHLLDLGFLDMVHARKAEGSARVFPALKLSKQGYYSETFSKFFSRYLENIGIKSDKTSFHSLRHNFEDACRAAKISGEVMDALQGHAEGGHQRPQAAP